MNKISKIIVLITIFTLMVCTSTAVFADDQLDLGTITGNENTNKDEEEIPNLSDSLTGGNTNNNTPSNDETDNSDKNNNVTDDKIQDLTPSTTNKNNGSTYQESNIPHAGVESSILMVTAFIICVATGIYTFMKLSDYSNI